MARISRLCRCGKIVTDRCECQAIKQASAEDYRPQASERYGKGWDDLSKRYRAHHPLCERCLEMGRTTPAIEVHHKQKARLRPDLVLCWDNLMSVCRACHIVLDRQ